MFERGEGTTDIYVWNQGWLEFHTCATCGCTTHWVPTDVEVGHRMGVNVRLVEGFNRSNSSLQHVDHGEKIISGRGTKWRGELS